MRYGLGYAVIFLLAPIFIFVIFSSLHLALRLRQLRAQRRNVDEVMTFVMCQRFRAALTLIRDKSKLCCPAVVEAWRLW